MTSETKYKDRKIAYQAVNLKGKTSIGRGTYLKIYKYAEYALVD